MLTLLGKPVCQLCGVRLSRQANLHLGGGARMDVDGACNKLIAFLKCGALASGVFKLVVTHLMRATYTL